jgi:hypothetical protein
MESTAVSSALAVAAGALSQRKAARRAWFLWPPRENTLNCCLQSQQPRRQILTLSGGTCLTSPLALLDFWICIVVWYSSRKITQNGLYINLFAETVPMWMLWMLVKTM